jgi:hypothetical protein
MSPDRKRAVIDLVRRAPEAKRQALAELGLAESTYYRWRSRALAHVDEMGAHRLRDDD